MDEEVVTSPQQSFNIVGHDQAEQAFLDAFNSGQMHHAWLITGAKGVGKASIAYKMARFLLHNAPDDPNEISLFGETLQSTPPDSLDTDKNSEINQLITAGSHSDLIIVERIADEKTGKMRKEILIDSIRNLQGFYNKTSSFGGWRIAIIDSADELNRNAANGILKTLEEPPKNSMLILISHAPGKLLPTIRSRCRQLRFKPLNRTVVTQVLTEKFPNLTMDEIASYAVMADGSPGYAVTLVMTESVKLYASLLGILSTLPQINVPDCHNFADGLTAKKNNVSGDKFIIFGELLLQFINRLSRHIACTSKGRNSAIEPILTGELELMEHLGSMIMLDRWGRIWEKVGKDLNQADRLNLDRKQTILNIFTYISQSLK